MGDTLNRWFGLGSYFLTRVCLTPRFPFAAPIQWHAPHGEHGVAGFVGEGGWREGVREREGERETIGYEP